MHKVGPEPLIYRTIGQQLALSSEKYKERVVIKSCFENKSITYEELKDKVSYANNRP